MCSKLSFINSLQQIRLWVHRPPRPLNRPWKKLEEREVTSLSRVRSRLAGHTEPERGSAYRLFSRPQRQKYLLRTAAGF